MTNFRAKIIRYENLSAWRAVLRETGKTLAVTNGCFDILHLGHVTYLEAARNQADALLVGLNSDSSVRDLKGLGRPVTPEFERALVLAALQCVDAVCIFRARSARNFLTVAKPDIWMKGGDYSPESLDFEERRAVERAGGRILILPIVPGSSTTVILRKITKLCRI